ncbi:MAG: carbohydrate binding family 9 domain-containing protein, partial [Bacteroidales bacterium]|nr:carbohydrate binding family 9 domain-containing protein [Bacteroidales bacterium]
MKFLHILLIACLSTSILAQKKNVKATYISTPLKIDGQLSEDYYQKGEPATDFVQLQPYNGRPAMQRSEVWFFYDQTAIYVGAMLHDTAPDSINNYLTERDNIGNSDYFGVYIDPYNEGQLSYGFYITPAGVQSDMKAIKSDRDREDGNWDAVWESNTQITDDGWIVEMRIPYSALRFPDQPVHLWGVNIFRNIRRHNSNNTWNLIDRNISGWIHQQGELSGIENIKPPTRLSFTPYLAMYVEQNEEIDKTDFTYKGGLDMKYGINESYTLDMMLIPDFGQIQSDDRQLNLGPYEIYYAERRQFFTEGMELFDRGDVFYSRRIGSRPKFAGSVNDELEENEVISDRPSETQLVNATKISGRSKNGFAVGFLNAMSLNSHATIKDTMNNSSREVLIQPFTNYNVSVIDQSLKNNSYVSLINTNMTMYDHSFGANVTATEFQIRDRSLTYAISGKGGISHRGAEDKETGWFGELELAKNSGKWQFGISQEAYHKDYNPNDMGFLRRNNLFDTD